MQPAKKLQAVDRIDKAALASAECIARLLSGHGVDYARVSSLIREAKTHLEIAREILTEEPYVEKETSSSRAKPIS